MLRAVYLFVFFVGIPIAGYAQNHPQGYFRNPLQIPILLAGNFGECRPNHFHSGLDIKTGGKENEPVFAAAEGYVSRIKMEPGGFGHGLYITHPNGYTTLYAHLNDFAPALQRYVRSQQYAKESWTVDLQLGPEQFPVRKGQQIAWSGNTGGSTAPHLHFEIRDTKTEHPLNPQLFGFEVNDPVAPVLKRLVLYNMDAGIYQTAPVLYPLQKRGLYYSPAKDSISVAAQKVGIGIVADDYMPGSDNTLALYTAEWYLDDALQGRIRLDEVGYEETRYLHAYADYSLRKLQKLWSQCMFQLPGNHLDRIYEALNSTRGIIQPGDDRLHAVRVVVRDVVGNASELRFQLKCSGAGSVRACDSPALPGRISTYNTNSAMFFLDKQALYDQACIDEVQEKDAKSLSPLVRIGRPDIPVHHYFELALKPDKLLPFAQRSKVAMVYGDGSEESGRMATTGLQGWYKASVRALGSYRLVLDTIAPVLKPMNTIAGNLSKARSIAVRASDNITSVKHFRAELDGHWLLFEQHGDVWAYVMDERCPPGKHRLIIEVSDENGNKRRASYAFTR